MMNQFFFIVLFLLIGGVLGYVFRIVTVLSKKKSLEQRATSLVSEAEEKAKQIISQAEAKAEAKVDEAKAEIKELRQGLNQTEQRLTKKEESLEQKAKEHEEQAKKNEELKNTLLEIKSKLSEKEQSIEQKFLEISKLSEEEAKNELFEKYTKKYSEDILLHIQKLEQDHHEKHEQKAKEILATTIQRLASSTAQDLTTTSVSIPSDEIKGKVIGKEGRNIRAFERAAGVELIVDDTPGAIVISSFDPIRRQIARLALENLILDGRIQPAKIEEFVEQARHEINNIIKKKGEEAVYELGIVGLDPRIVAILGRLYFRTSYGQNVLQHSIEMAHIAGMIAEELGANVAVAKTGALVHDIGKALDHEMPGGHVQIGIRILEKFGADQKVIDAMKSHHDDVPHATIEAVIVQTADNISGGRPGARRDTVENYLKRLQDLENVANGFSGVEKSYALQAGREIRIFVKPNNVSDLEAKNLAQEVARRIESELKYPGEIKVTVIRENRIVEFAR